MLNYDNTAQKNFMLERQDDGSQYHNGIDFSKLQTIVNPNADTRGGMQYEPGTQNKNNLSDLPVLKPVDNKVKIMQNLQNFSDTESETESQSRPDQNRKEQESGEDEPAVQEAPQVKRKGNGTKEETKTKQDNKKDYEGQDDDDEEDEEDQNDDNDEEEEEKKAGDEPNKRTKLVTDIKISDMRQFLLNPIQKVTPR